MPPPSVFYESLFTIRWLFYCHSEYFGISILCELSEYSFHGDENIDNNIRNLHRSTTHTIWLYRNDYIDTYNE